MVAAQGQRQHDGEITFLSSSRRRRGYRALSPPKPAPVTTGPNMPAGWSLRGICTRISSWICGNQE